MPFIASFSVDCPFFDIVTLYVNDDRKGEYSMINAVYIDIG
jgi:hypothetical protein